MKKKTSNMGKEIPELDGRWVEKVLFSDESHFMVQENKKQHVRRRKGKKIAEQHIN